MKQELVACLIRDNERVWDMPTDGLLVALDQLMQANITQEQSSRLRVFADGEAGHADTRCKFQRKREREMSLNRLDLAILSAKYFNVSANKVQIFSVSAK